MARDYRSYLGPGKKYYQTVNLSTGGTTYSETTVGDYDDYYHLSRSDIVKRQADASGWRAPTPYSAFLNTYTQPHGQNNYQVGSTLYKWWGEQVPEQKGAYGLPTFPSGLRQRAEVNALTKLKDQKINLAQAFGERKQTTRLVANSLESMTEVWKQMEFNHAKRNARKLREFRKKLNNPVFWADRWLELQYGWKPAMSDIYGAIEILDAAEQREGPRRYRISVSGKVREDSKVNRRYYDNNRLWQADELTRIMHGCYTKLYYEPADTAPFQSLSQSGITNPALLAWELLPWSFVVDWALPIGKWLSVLDADLGWKFLSGTVSEITRVRQGTKYSTGPSVYAQGAYGTHQAQRLRLVRTVYSGTPFPRPPSFKDPRSALHLANAVALFTSTVLGGSSKVRL